MQREEVTDGRLVAVDVCAATQGNPLPDVKGRIARVSRWRQRARPSRVDC